MILSSTGAAPDNAGDCIGTVRKRRQLVDFKPKRVDRVIPALASPDPSALRRRYGSAGTSSSDYSYEVASTSHRNAPDVSDVDLFRTYT